jgi:hypothetical protein
MRKSLEHGCNGTNGWGQADKSGQARYITSPRSGTNNFRILFSPLSTYIFLGSYSATQRSLPPICIFDLHHKGILPSMKSTDNIGHVLFSRGEVGGKLLAG